MEKGMNSAIDQNNRNIAADCPEFFLRMQDFSAPFFERQYEWNKTFLSPA